MMNTWDFELAVSAKKTIDDILITHMRRAVEIIRHILTTAKKGAVHVGA